MSHGQMCSYTFWKGKTRNEKLSQVGENSVKLNEHDICSLRIHRLS